VRHHPVFAIALVATLAPAAVAVRGSAAPRVAQATPGPLPTLTAPPASPVPKGLIIPPVPAVEPGYRAPAAAEPNANIVGVTQQPFVGIGLQDAVAMALLRNSDLAVSQQNRQIAGYEIVAAQGAYDVRFTLQPSYNYQKTASLTPFAAGPGGGPVTQTTLGASAGFGGQTLGGATYQIGINGEGIRSDNTGNGYNPFNESALSFNLTQPLLRGTYSASHHQLDLARINAGASTQNTLVSASNTLANVEESYWDLVSAWRNVAIQEETLRQAKAQQQSNARQVKQGAAAPVEVVESDTQVNIFQDNVFSALQAVARLQNQLKELILSDPSDPIWMANIVPTTPAKTLPSEPNLQDVVVAALKNRPEVGQLTQSRLAADSNLAYARNQTKPQVDLNLGYTSNGFAGNPLNLLQNPVFGVFGPVFKSVNQVIAFVDKQGAGIPPLIVVPPGAPPNFTGGFGTSVNNLLANRLPEAAIAVTIGLPIQNRTARANLAIAQEQEKEINVQQAALIQRIIFEARNALQNLQASQSRLIAASAARDAAERVYASELRKFRAGTSTTFLVLQRQTEVANQRGRELLAQTDLDKAVVELERVSGTILARDGVNLATVGTAPTPATALPSASPPPLPQISPLP
jgi:outer membrane protein TolC